MIRFDPDLDIRSTADAVVVNTVNTVGVMGAGVARAVRERWPEVMGPYRAACASGRLMPGTLHLHQVPGGPLIVNLATKRDWRQPSRITWAGAGLVLLSMLLQRRHAERPGSVATVTLPPPGCGHGGLDRGLVHNLIRTFLAPLPGLGIQVTVTDREAVGPDRPFRYAGIGARKTPESVLVAMTKAARLLEERGFRLRSGGAAGADSAFEAGVRAPSAAEIFLPCSAGLASRPQAQVSREPLHLRMALAVHPAPDRLSPKGRKLMARNGAILFGEDFADPVDVVVCWTAGGRGEGGTGQALRLARAIGIPVIDLGRPDFEGMTPAAIAAMAEAFAKDRRLRVRMPRPEPAITLASPSCDRRQGVFDF